MWKQLFALKSTNRAWHLPVIAGLCVGVPLLLAWQMGDMQAGKLASVGALVILYIQSKNLINRMMILMVCGFGFIFSYTYGALFSHLFWLAPIALALYTFAVHYSLFRLNLNRPPGNFFFYNDYRYGNSATSRYFSFCIRYWLRIFRCNDFVCYRFDI